MGEMEGAMLLEKAIAEFLRFLSAERNLAPRTVMAYGYDLERVRGHLEGDGKGRRVDSVEPYDLKDYLATLKEENKCRPATLCRVISSMRVFFSWATQQGYSPADPALGLHHPKKPKKLPIYLMPGEVQDLAAVVSDEDENGQRDRTILLLLVMTGMRLSELVGLDLPDVDFESGTMKVLGKGRKERLVPMNHTSRRVLEEWLAVRPRGRDGCQCLFLSRDGERISRRTVQYLVRKAVKGAGLDPRISPHKLRHTFATMLYAEAVDLRDIQELLGHSNIASTSVYTHTNVDKVRAAVNKLRVR